MIKPMKCKDLKPLLAWGTDSPYDGIAQYLTEAYVAEPKLDGVRVTLNLGTESNVLWTSQDRSANFPHLAQAVVPDIAGVVLDGELMAPSGKICTHTGTWTDSMLNASVALVNSNPAGSVATQKAFGNATLFVFDVLAAPGGDSLMDTPYEERRALLEAVVAVLTSHYPTVAIQAVPVLPATVDSIVASIDAGFEGVVLKRKTSVYRPGKRGGEWLKVKRFSTADAFVVGSHPGEGSNTGLVGSLELALMTETGPMPIASVGNLTQETRQALTDPQGNLVASAFGVVCEFAGQGVTKDGRIRHPHLIRFRPDKAAADCDLSQLDTFSKV